MKYCKTCLEPTTFSIQKFSAQGICFTCEYFSKFVNEFDETERSQILKDICLKYKNSDQTFDCIIGVSGGKDSTRQALFIREKLKMRPLLVCCTYPPEQLTDLGAKNLSNLIKLGFDLLVTAPSPQTWKKILKKGFYGGNYLRGPELALYSSLPQIAIKYKIKLIFWGEGGNGKTSSSYTINKDKEYDGNLLRNNNTLKNCDLSWMSEVIEDEAKLIPYKYPSEKEFLKNDIQIIYLGWFIKDWSILNNAKYASLNGLELRSDDVKNTGDLYGSMALDEDWVIVNQMIKYYKFGFGRVTDYLNYEIRQGKISREEAIKLVEKYDGKCDQKYIKSFCDYIEINENEFWEVVSNFVNKDLFTLNNKKDSNKYLPKFKVGTGI
jgi:N-acetyl sugar amidotransferase